MQCFVVVIVFLAARYTNVLPGERRIAQLAKVSIDPKIVEITADVERTTPEYFVKYAWWCFRGKSASSFFFPFLTCSVLM